MAILVVQGRRGDAEVRVQFVIGEGGLKSLRLMMFEVTVACGVYYWWLCA